MNVGFIIAALSGQSLIHGLIGLIIFGLIFWLLWWLINYIGIPEPFSKMVRVILALVAVIFLIKFLLGLAGYPLVAWP